MAEREDEEIDGSVKSESDLETSKSVLVESEPDSNDFENNLDVLADRVNLMKCILAPVLEALTKTESRYRSLFHLRNMVLSKQARLFDVSEALLAARTLQTRLDVLAANRTMLANKVVDECEELLLETQQRAASEAESLEYDYMDMYYKRVSTMLQDGYVTEAAAHAVMWARRGDPLIYNAFLYKRLEWLTSQGKAILEEERQVSAIGEVRAQLHALHVRLIRFLEDDRAEERARGNQLLQELRAHQTRWLDEDRAEYQARVIQSLQEVRAAMQAIEDRQ